MPTYGDSASTPLPVNITPETYQTLLNLMQPADTLEEHDVTIMGTLIVSGASGLGGATINVYEVLGGAGLNYLGSATTNLSGNFTFYHSWPNAGVVTIRAVYAGLGQYGPSNSPDVPFTILTWTVNTTTTLESYSPTEVYEGDTVSFTGKVVDAVTLLSIPGIVGQPLQLQISTDGTNYSTVSTGLIGANGLASASYSFMTQGNYWIRFYFPGYQTTY